MKYTEEMDKWLKENIKGIVYEKVAVMFSEKFGVETNKDRIRQHCHRIGASNGMYRYNLFKKGNTICKGRKMSEQTKEKLKEHFFQKGSVPITSCPTGTIRKRYGYQFIRIDERRRKGKHGFWIPLHVYLYEKAHNCRVPKDKRVIFLDGNKNNFDVDNLEMVTKGELGTLVITKRNYKNAELTRAGLNIIRIKNKIKELIKK